MTTPAIKTVTRLEPIVYDKLLKSLLGSTPAVTNDTTPLVAGFQLGVQHVLAKLREGFVTETA